PSITSLSQTNSVSHPRTHSRMTQHTDQSLNYKAQLSAMKQQDQLITEEKVALDSNSPYYVLKTGLPSNSSDSIINSRSPLSTTYTQQQTFQPYSGLHMQDPALPRHQLIPLYPILSQQAPSTKDKRLSHKKTALKRGSSAVGIGSIKSKEAMDANDLSTHD